MLDTLITLNTLDTLMCPKRLLYIPEDGHMIDRNMKLFIVYINIFSYTHVHLFVPSLYIYE
jgi:hypothetical protein